MRLRVCVDGIKALLSRWAIGIKESANAMQSIVDASSVKAGLDAMVRVKSSLQDKMF